MSPEDQPDKLNRQEARKRHRKLKKLEHVNTWDVPEFMRGAKPRAEPSEREAFERRSFAVYQAEQAARSAETVAYELERNIAYTRQFSDDISELALMFPDVEVAVVQELYLFADGDKNLTIEQLLSLSVPHHEPDS